VRLGYELSDKVGEESALISRLVAISITRMMNDCVAELAGRADSPNLYWALATVPAREAALRETWGDTEVDLVASVPRLARVRAGEELSAAEWRSVLGNETETGACGRSPERTANWRRWRRSKPFAATPPPTDRHSPGNWPT